VGRLYLSPTELLLHPVGIALSGPLAQVQASGAGAVDLLLMKASQRVDGFCNKRIGAPPATTISGVSSLPPGTVQLPVASTQGFDTKEEQAVYIGTSGTQELIPVLGVVMTSNVAPYPGTLTLASGTAYIHNNGDIVQGVYYEVATAGSAGWEPYTSTILSQAAQIAEAHAPLIGQSGGNLTRRVFLKHYPIIALYQVEHAYPFSNTYGPVPTQGILINTQSGFYRLSLGSVVIPRGFIRTTYTAGYQVPPDDIKDATAYYLADELQIFFNISGAVVNGQGKRRMQFLLPGMKEGVWAQKAEDILAKGNYVRTV
jgi:hypothetical protein